MTRIRNIVGRVGESVTLTTRFYTNGALFNPYSIVSVNVYSNESATELVATLTATQVSTGVYSATWSVPAGTAPRIYYDRWTWQATLATGTQARLYGFRVDGGIPEDQCGSHNGPLFVTPREVNFFEHINKELIQRIIAQRIIYYSVSEEHTKSHKLYDEAIKKTVFTPVEINALVLYKNPVQKNTQFTIDTIYSIETYFHMHELKERQIIPREGDFIKFGNIIYEIHKLTRPQITYGQMNNEVMVKAECIVSRKSQFEVMDNIPGVPE